MSRKIKLEYCYNKLLLITVLLVLDRKNIIESQKKLNAK